jgi:mannosyltransferase
MTMAGPVREGPMTARPNGNGTGIPARRTPFDDLADQAARLPWCWPALLTLALGLYQLSRPELWRDELASWSLASRPLSTMIATARHTGATQLAYYLLLHVWMSAFGDSVYAMRALSVLTMAAAAALVAVLGRRLAGAWAGLLSGLVFALVPSVSRFAQEIRFYSLEVLVATLATLLLVRALDRPTAPRWLGYGASLALLGYIDLVALSLVAGHLAGAAVRWWHDREAGQLWFLLAAAGGLLVCVPLALAGSAQARSQVIWIPRPGLDFFDIAAFGRNLFYSTSVAAALIILGVIAWAVARREAAFVTAIAIAPVAAVWLVSQGPYSFFFARYLLLTVAAWAILAGIALSRFDVRIAGVAVLVIAIFGAGDQKVIREPGAHSWSMYPAGYGSYYVDYQGAAAAVASQARAGDGIVYQGEVNGGDWLMISYGLQYYLSQDLRPGKVPHELFIAKTAAQAAALYPIPCKYPAACLGQEQRIWVIGSGDLQTPYSALTQAQIAALEPYYVSGYRMHVLGLTVFLLERM